jgi:hypothetical protein
MADKRVVPWSAMMTNVSRRRGRRVSTGVGLGTGGRVRVWVAESRGSSVFYDKDIASS